ncbi:acyl carrier protein [Peptoanaerobacter stomatis]|uniref:Acyl carrier protein n=1 Tax=Peptoanaerobacter stomatis TaxID=796937 RepID=J5WDB9_9FIRM|nr:acyl carrier protein [Peptoanaerobacter stomatis]EHL17145.1 acyl carrier protein [Peptoanaerobacter stomatis]EJU21107.1 putative acyl carrier protein [Peptoanaerobacter stomatis]NWO26000.1 acyl carrier protein [Peptostreptococcaceae bacterium oral taxon 081]
MVFEKIRKIISTHTGLDKNNINLDSNIVDDLELDSIEIFDILSEIEGEFSIEIDEDSYESFKTIKDVVEYIENAV